VSINLLSPEAIYSLIISSFSLFVNQHKNPDKQILAALYRFFVDYLKAAKKPKVRWEMPRGLQFRNSLPEEEISVSSESQATRSLDGSLIRLVHKLGVKVYDDFLTPGGYPARFYQCLFNGIEGEIDSVPNYINPFKSMLRIIYDLRYSCEQCEKISETSRIATYGLIIDQCFKQQASIKDLLDNKEYLIKKNNLCPSCHGTIKVDDHKFVHSPKLLFLAVEDSVGENTDAFAVKLDHLVDFCGEVYDLYAKSIAVRTEIAQMIKSREKDGSQRVEERGTQEEEEKEVESESQDEDGNEFRDKTEAASKNEKMIGSQQVEDDESQNKNREEEERDHRNDNEKSDEVQEVADWHTYVIMRFDERWFSVDSYEIKEANAEIMELFEELQDQTVLIYKAR